MASRITVTVVGTPVTDDTIIYRDGTGERITQTFNNFNGFGRVPISSDPFAQAEFIASKFQTDYNSSGVYDITVNNNVVTIIHPQDDHFNGSRFVNLQTEPAMTLDVDQVFIDDDEIIEIDLSQSSAPCTFVTTTFLSNTTYPYITVRWNDQVMQVVENTNTLSIDVPRGVGSVVFYRGETQEPEPGILTGSIVFQIPDIFEITGVNVVNSFFGTQATIYTNSEGGNVQYQFVYQPDESVIPSSDPNEYTSGATLVGFPSGNYVAYAKDEYGCETYRTFEAINTDDFLRAPFYSFVSAINDFPFFKSKTLLDGHNLNQDNRLTHEIPLKNQTKINYTHPVWAGQSGRIQFRSSAEINKAYIIDCDNQVLELDVQQKTDNINSDNILEGNYELDGQNFRVSFTPGDVYNSNGNPISQHSYNGTLPIYYEVGVVLSIENVVIGVINDIYTENGITYAAFQVPQGTNITNGSGKIQSVHTIEGYEIYEFGYDVTSIQTDQFSIAIQCENPSSEIAYWRTNPIRKIEDSIENYHRLDYYSSEFNEVNYTTSIKHKRYVEYNQLPIPITPSSSIDTYETDTDIIKLDSSGLRTYAFNFKNMPNEIAMSLVECITYSDVLIIDGKSYTSKESAELVNKGFQVSEVKANLTAGARIDLGLSFVPPFSSSADSFYPIVP